MRTNQKRFQCSLFQEKRRRGTWLTSGKEERVEEGSWFQSSEPMKAKARVQATGVLARGQKHHAGQVSVHVDEEASGGGRQTDKAT